MPACCNSLAVLCLHCLACLQGHIPAGSSSDAALLALLDLFLAFMLRLLNLWMLRCTTPVNVHAYLVFANRRSYGLLLKHVPAILVHD
eukprot:1146478-Pelagomonas_calceolata.AAC.4